MGSNLQFTFDIDIWCSVSALPEPDAGGLTAAQKALRDANDSLPPYVKRSIDTFRVASGLPPLWALATAVDIADAIAAIRRRTQWRERKRRQRARMAIEQEGQDG